MTSQFFIAKGTSWATHPVSFHFLIANSQMNAFVPRLFSVSWNPSYPTAVRWNPDWNRAANASSKQLWVQKFMKNTIKNQTIHLCKNVPQIFALSGYGIWHPHLRRWKVGQTSVCSSVRTINTLEDFQSSWADMCCSLAGFPETKYQECSWRLGWTILVCPDD